MGRCPAKLGYRSQFTARAMLHQHVALGGETARSGPVGGLGSLPRCFHARDAREAGWPCYVEQVN